MWPFQFNDYPYRNAVKSKYLLDKHVCIEAMKTTHTYIYYTIIRDPYLK